jgi:nucleoside-diphosphate-sugar epimerase
VKRFVFSSSCSVYGIAGDEAIDETGRLEPVTEYAKSKVATEKEVAGLADKSFSPVFMRNSTVYGLSPMHRFDLVVNNLTGWAHTTGKLKLMSDGTPWRPLIHIDDLCAIFIAMLTLPVEQVHNQVFNVGEDAENYRIRDISAAIQGALPGCEVEYTGEHGADTRSYRVDFGKLARVLENHYRFRWDIAKGIEQLLDAYRARRLTFEDFQGRSFIRLKQLRHLMEAGLVDERLFWKGGTAR